MTNSTVISEHAFLRFWLNPTNSVRRFGACVIFKAELKPEVWNIASIGSIRVLDSGSQTETWNKRIPKLENIHHKST